MIEKAALCLARWLDTEGRLALATQNLGPALRLLGVPAFRGAQLDIVEAALQGRSVLLVSPTGSGKSLTFQVPAVLTPGLCVVISPLKALMSDQVSGLLRLRIPATFVNSDLSSDEKRLRIEMIGLSAFKFLYLAPERFFGVGDDERSKLQRLRPAYLVVDEAHCVDRWGRDFRPEYGRLDEIRQLLGSPPVLALTATAGRATQSRILDSLGATDAAVFLLGVDRPNIALLRISLAVDRRPARISSLLSLAERLGAKTMIFVPTIKIGKELSEFLATDGVPTSFYHGQLRTNEKEDLLQRFGGGLKPTLSRIICTNAFGMGVDIPDVRIVIHWQHPASPEDYLQEFGRAGRNGKRAVAILFRDPKPNGRSVGLLDFMAERTAEQASVRERDHLIGWRRGLIREMQALAFSENCFRDGLLRYFGETRTRPHTPWALRIVSWLFSDRARRPERGLCCDACDMRGRRRGDHTKFVCDALAK